MIPPFLIPIIAFLKILSSYYLFISSVVTSGLDGYTFQVGGVARISYLGRSFK